MNKTFVGWITTFSKMFLILSKLQVEYLFCSPQHCQPLNTHRSKKVRRSKLTLSPELFSGVCRELSRNFTYSLVNNLHWLTKCYLFCKIQIFSAYFRLLVFYKMSNTLITVIFFFAFCSILLFSVV